MVRRCADPQLMTYDMRSAERKEGDGPIKDGHFLLRPFNSRSFRLVLDRSLRKLFVSWFSFFTSWSPSFSYPFTCLPSPLPSLHFSPSLLQLSILGGLVNVLCLAPYLQKELVCRYYSYL